MVELTDEDFAAADERGRIVAETEPHARAVRFDRVSGLLVIDLTNGATFTVPARYLQGLEAATDDQIAAVRTGGGYGLHWDDLDIDITVGGILAGRFGNAHHMAEFWSRHRDAA